jgi:ABC-type polysaccharide/polyol phosphate export permease
MDQQLKLFLKKMTNIKYFYIKLSCLFELAWIEVKLKYDRSILGPFWISISMVILILGLSYAYGSIFDLSAIKSLPWIASGVVTWQFITTTIEESCQKFITPESLNISLSPIEFILINVFKNLIIFFHNFAVLILILIFTETTFNYNFLFIFYGLIILIINSLCVGVIFGFLCCRYRDFILIVRNLLFIIFLITPIFWSPEVLSKNRFLLVDYNIVFHTIQTIRDPLLGNSISSFTFYFTILFTFFLSFFSFLIYKKYKRKYVFWI